VNKIRRFKIREKTCDELDFSWGDDREQARENLVVALKELSIRGDFR
jgi:biotin carboxylase